MATLLVQPTETRHCPASNWMDKGYVLPDLTQIIDDRMETPLTLVVDDAVEQCSQEAPERLRRAETVLRNRTGRITLVLEQCMDSHNHQAVLRTAEALGIQHVWLVNPNERQVKKHKGGSSTTTTTTGQKKITKNCACWLSIREFTTIRDCITALRETGCTIWATDLAPDAVPLTSTAKPEDLPQRLAIVIGRETDGVSAEMLDAADKRVYFPIVGFTESLNLSVATALVLQRILDWFPDIRGDLNDHDKEALRATWYPHLIKNATQARQAQQWLDGSHEIPPLADLRREKLQYNESWIPKSVRARESQMPEVQERRRKLPGPTPSTSSTTSETVG